VSVMCYLRHTAGCLSSCFFLIFSLHTAVLSGLVVIPCEAASIVSTPEYRSSYGLKKEPSKISGEPDSGLNDVRGSTLLSQSEYTINDEQLFGGDEKPDGTGAAVEPVTRAVPIWGEKIRDMGYELPLPFGAGVNLVYMDQGIDIRNLKIGFGGPTREISWVSFSNASAEDKAAAARLDVWLLPFANIYGILGYLDGEAQLDVNLPGITIDVPGFGPQPIVDPATLKFDIDYTGTTVGGGITLAGGYKNIFGSLDANYSYSDIDVVDGDIETLTISPRLGVLVDPASIKGSFAFWIGAMYMDYKQTVTDSINLKELDPGLPSVELEFEIDIENEEPWNFLMGGQWEINKRWQVVAEGGIGNRRQLIFSGLFRF